MRERYSKFLIFILLLCITGCSNTSQMEQKNIENGNNAELKQNNQQPRCKHSSTVLGSYVAAHSTCLFHLLTQAKKRGMIVSSSQLLPISNILARRTIR